MLVSPGGGGGGPTTPTVGMLPAKIEVDSVHMNATAIANFFIGFSSFEVEKRCRDFYIKKNETEWNYKAGKLARQARANYYPVCIRSTSR